MFFKLSLKNVKKSFRDYTVYFLTLTFGVCLFYVFNSMDSQQAMLDLSDSKKQILVTMTQMLGYISVFVAIVLGFLIVYANRFLIRRRKKELGVYMLLGMERGQISRVLILETFLIGLFALAIGLLLGVFASQGFSVLTGYLFEVNLKSIQFTFSPGAFGKTILYFGVIFFIVMIFNMVSVSRVRLIDLLTAAKKNESLRMRRTSVTIVAFLLSVAFLGTAYYRIIRDGLLMLDSALPITILMGCVGTVLFFFSLSGFLLRVVQSNKKMYFSGLNMFVLRQVNSRINTAFLSMSIISLMLFFTICIFSGGMSLSNAFTGNLQLTTPYDATASVFHPLDSKDGKSIDLAAELKKYGADTDAYADQWMQLDVYFTSVAYKNVLNGEFGAQNIKFSASPDGGVSLEENFFTAVSLSSYNSAMRLQGKPEISMKENEYALLCNVSAVESDYNRALKAGNSIQVSGKKLTPAMPNTLYASIQTDYNAMEVGLLVLPDDLTAGLGVNATLLNLQLREGIDGMQTKTVFQEAMREVFKNHKEEFSRVETITKASVYDNAIGIKVELSYIAIYVGIIFLIASAAVLALQQLSEASDNTERYGLLRKLGADNGLINRALLRQIAIYFFLPLALAVIHSIVGIHVINQSFSVFGGMNLLGSILVIALLLVVVYGGYFLATYFGSRSMIRQRKS